MTPTSMKSLENSFKGPPQEEEEEATPIHGDVLETTLSFVPLVDLLPASRVSKSWSRAVFSSLRNFNKTKPWFLVHSQRNSSSSSSSDPLTTFGYDPRSDVWIRMDPKPLTKYVSTLRSSPNNFLYMLSSSTLSFSVDPLHLTWRHVDSPATSRVDPIVALCGDRIVVAGSAWDFEDDPLAVEVYCLDDDTWHRAQSMPDSLKDSASATWLSFASNEAAVFVTEKASGVSYSFDPLSGVWRGPYDLRPDPRVFFTAVAFVGGNLVVAGLVPEGLSLWRVRMETMDCEPIGEAPAEMVEKLKDEEGSLRQVELCPAENLVYIYNPSEPAELVYCEMSISGGGGVLDCGWGSARNAGWKEGGEIGGRTVFTCGRVEMEHLQTAMRSASRKFVVVA